ncbi:hypothetical protein OG590_33340 [Streptomyces goshikiensis]|uniref:DUF6766 family protein n=1 Tax=Streptomyces goshikiensis TaxID=1942 RepID=UPI0033FD2726|nr:hypothetical protein OG590_33340 [Streptomyces goshikiensis]
MRHRRREDSCRAVRGPAFEAALEHAGQSIAGHPELNSVLTAQSLQPLSFPDYLFTSDLMVDVTENWQSEFLQFFLYIVGTVWLLQRGSPESKPLDKAGTETDREQKVGAWATPDSPKSASAPGLRRSLCSRSSVTSAEFWHRTLQNWQSELLAVGPITQGDPLRRCVLLLAHPGRSDRAEW